MDWPGANSNSFFFEQAICIFASENHFYDFLNLKIIAINSKKSFFLSELKEKDRIHLF